MVTLEGLLLQVDEHVSLQSGTFRKTFQTGIALITTLRLVAFTVALQCLRRCETTTAHVAFEFLEVDVLDLSSMLIVRR
jgi:hypothetical protein